MTTRDPDPTTAHDPTARPLLEELPDALAKLEQQLARITAYPDDPTPPISRNPSSTIGQARTELNRIIAQIRQSAPAELEVQWLRVPTADAKTILYTVDGALAGDPTGSVLLRWPAYDALRHLLWRDDKLFAAVIGLLQDRGRADVALRLRNGSPDTTALQGLSFAPDKEFIAAARARMQAARAGEAAEVAKMDGGPVVTPGPESRTPNPDGGEVWFGNEQRELEAWQATSQAERDEQVWRNLGFADALPFGEFSLVMKKEYGTGKWPTKLIAGVSAILLTETTIHASSVDEARRKAIEWIRPTFERALSDLPGTTDDGVRGPWSNITPYVVAQELRRVPSGGTLLTEPWISAIAYHYANNHRRWLEIRNVLRQYKVLADVLAAIRHHARPIDPRDQLSPERQVAKLTAWFRELRHRLHTSVEVDADARVVLDNVIDAAIGPADPNRDGPVTVSLRASMAALRVVTERLAMFAPQELAAEIETLEKLERDVVHLFGIFGNVGDIQIGGAGASVKPHDPIPSVVESDVKIVCGTGGEMAMPGGARRPDEYVGGDVTLSDAIRSQEERNPEGAAALREAGGDALKAVEILRARAASPVSQSDALRRAMTEIDRGLDGYKLSPEVELARIQVDVLLLLVETLRGGAEYQIGGMIAGALEQVADQREREYAERWKDMVFMAGQDPPKPTVIADLRAVAAAVKQRLGGGA